MATEQKTWVEGPMKLITVPSTYIDISSHYAVKVASEMANVHNCLIRSLNAIVLQGPHVPSHGQPGYKAKDVTDLLYYIEAWCKTIHHHHSVEETVLFPALEELLGEKGSMGVAMSEHEAFHSGLETLEKYAAAMQKTPQGHTWKQTQAIIDSFAKVLGEHLEAEVPLMLSLSKVDESALMALMMKTEEAARSSGGIAMLFDLFPLVLGACDKSSPGGEKFPPFPTFMTYLVAYVCSWKHAGAWRFNPCDMFGHPRALTMMRSSR